MSTAPEAKKDDAKAKPAKAAKTPKAATPAKAQKSAAPATADAAAATQVAKPARKPAAKKAPAKTRASDTAARPVHTESRLAQVLVAPIVSEKATMAVEKHNQVLFKVLRNATKPEIKAAVELMFKVQVDSVQTVQHKGKTKRFGKSTGRRDHIKKAYVCLAEGQELNFSGEGA
jgi:large subunit ribosomal protein L23